MCRPAAYSIESAQTETAIHRGARARDPLHYSSSYRQTSSMIIVGFDRSAFVVFDLKGSVLVSRITELQCSVRICSIIVT